MPGKGISICKDKKIFTYLNICFDGWIFTVFESKDGRHYRYRDKSH